MNYTKKNITPNTQGERRGVFEIVQKRPALRVFYDKMSCPAESVSDPQ